MIVPYGFKTSEERSIVARVRVRETGAAAPGARTAAPGFAALAVRCGSRCGNLVIKHRSTLLYTCFAAQKQRNSLSLLLFQVETLFTARNQSLRQLGGYFSSHEYFLISNSLSAAPTSKYAHPLGARTRCASPPHPKSKSAAPVQLWSGVYTVLLPQLTLALQSNM